MMRIQTFTTEFTIPKFKKFSAEFSVNKVTKLESNGGVKNNLLIYIFQKKDYYAPLHNELKHKKIQFQICVCVWVVARLPQLLKSMFF